MNQHDILMTAVAEVSKGQTDMSYKGELQTLTKLIEMEEQLQHWTWCVPGWLVPGVWVRSPMEYGYGC